MRAREWRSPGCRRVPDPHIEVIVDGLLFQASQAYEPFKVGYILNGWRGWREGPESKTSDEQWEDSDGGIAVEPLFQGRELEFSGYMRGRDEAHLHQMMEALGAVLTRPRRGNLVVREQLIKMERQISVRRGASPVMVQQTETIATWSAQFSSVDFRRLGTVEQSEYIYAAEKTLQNIGNVNAALRLTMVGPLTDPGISWPGGAWVYSGEIPDGNIRVVDMESRVVRDPNSSLRYRGSVGGAGEWLNLPPGGTKVKRTDNGSGTVTATWRHSWA